MKPVCVPRSAPTHSDQSKSPTFQFLTDTPEPHKTKLPPSPSTQLKLPKPPETHSPEASRGMAWLWASRVPLIRNVCLWCVPEILKELARSEKPLGLESGQSPAKPSRMCLLPEIRMLFGPNEPAKGHCSNSLSPSFFKNSRCAEEMRAGGKQII